METRRWFELAAAFTTVLVLGVLIGYGVARSTSPDVPERRYTVGSCSNHSTGYLYRYDVHTGTTWRAKIYGDDPWEEILELKSWDAKQAAEAAKLAAELKANPPIDWGAALDAEAAELGRQQQPRNEE